MTKSYSRTKMHPDDLRSVLNKTLSDRLKPFVSEAEWGVLKNQGYPRDFAAGQPEATQEALDFLLEVLRPVQVPVPQPRRRTAKVTSGKPAKTAVVGQAHDAAIAVVLAAHATGPSRFDDGVLTFRREVLGDKLLLPEQLEPWVVEQAKRDGPADRIVIRRGISQLLTVDTLAYGREWPRHVPVKHDGVLDRLRELSERLANNYGWQPVQGTAFVLTGIAPAAPSIRVHVSHWTELRARSRIKLDVHPTCTPQEVAERYAAVRREQFGRLRRLTPKHAQLAAFFAEQSPITPPHELRQAWNKWCDSNTHGHGKGRDNWKYDKARGQQFSRDARRAFERLTELSGAKS